MTRSHHYFTSTLLSICTLLCMMPAMVQAQLFGGMIKSKNGPPVIPGIIPSNITLGTNQKYFVASVYDTDYLPYTAPTVAATTATVAANGAADPTVNVQGAITTTGVTVMIAATATGSGTLPAYTTTVSIPATMTQDGIGRDLTLSWAAQSYTTATTSIAATLKAVGGTLNAIKLDINAGIGSNYNGVLLGQLLYPYNSAGTTTTYSVRDIPGIPDKMFGRADNGGVVRHNFLYLPVTGEDGKVWLNNNLGADYANVSSASFNPAQQATAATDYHAYGSLFQWGRKPDGHELMQYTAASNGAPIVAPASSQRSNTPLTSAFIYSSKTPAPAYDWRTTTDNSLWAAEASANNPCPSGFRVPTEIELSNLVGAAMIKNKNDAASSNLHLPAAGRRFCGDASLAVAGTDGSYWSSTVNGISARELVFWTSMGWNTENRAYGYSVRCLQN